MVAICRLCASLKKSDTLTFISDRNDDLYLKLLKCCRLNINTSKFLPRGVCPECINNLNTSFEFYNRVQESQRALEKLWNVRNIKNSSFVSATKKRVFEEEKSFDFGKVSHILKKEKTPIGAKKLTSCSEAYVDTDPGDLTLFELSNDVENISFVDESSKDSMKTPMQKSICSKNEEVIEVKIQKIKTKTVEVALSGRNLQDAKDEKLTLSTNLDFHAATTSDQQKSNYAFGDRFMVEQQNPIDHKLHHINFEGLSYSKKGSAINCSFFQKSSTWLDYVWKCLHCSQTFSTAQELAKHYQEEGKEAVWVCADCLKIFPRYYSLINHIRQRHRRHLSLLCDICNVTCKSFTVLDNHRQSMHDDLILKMKICSKCGKGFNSTNSLQIHSKCHLPDEMRVHFNCNVCNKNFRSLSSLKFHQKMHTGLKDFVCDQCGKKFIQRANLDEHLISHLDFTPYECNLCNKLFKTSERLSKHKTRHTDDKPFKCNWAECEKTFRTKDAMNSHLRTHTGEMPFRCDFCQKQFRFRSTLLTHHNIHTGVRPYSCNDCNHQFTNWPNYNKHMKRRHGLDVSSKNPRGKKPTKPKTNINNKVIELTRKININGGQLAMDQEVYNEYTVEEQHLEDVELDIMELKEFNLEPGI